jgi:hypothetical protein
MTDVTISDSTAWNTVQEENQYSLAKILGIWVAAALPMAILGWVANGVLFSAYHWHQPWMILGAWSSPPTFLPFRLGVFAAPGCP